MAVSPKNAEKGDTVTVTVTPDEGYVLASLTVTDKDGDKVSTTKGEDGKYTFKMPASAVTVEAVFAEEGTVSELPFEDVKVEQWFYDAVKYVYDNEMMNGVSATEFAPDASLTRGTIARVLFNLEGAASGAAATFDDVPADAGLPMRSTGLPPTTLSPATATEPSAPTTTSPVSRWRPSCIAMRSSRAMMSPSRAI